MHRIKSNKSFKIILLLIIQSENMLDIGQSVTSRVTADLKPDLMSVSL